MKKNFMLFSILGIALISSCDTKPTVYDCTGIAPTYTSDIAAIFNTNCALSGCHSNVSPQGNVDLSNYITASNASLNGAVLGCIQHLDGYRPMPDNAPQLSEQNIRLVSCWVQNGAPL